MKGCQKKQTKFLREIRDAVFYINYKEIKSILRYKYDQRPVRSISFFMLITCMHTKFYSLAKEFYMPWTKRSQIQMRSLGPLPLHHQFALQLLFAENASSCIKQNVFASFFYMLLMRYTIQYFWEFKLLGVCVVVISSKAISSLYYARGVFLLGQPINRIFEITRPQIAWESLD